MKFLITIYLLCTVILTTGFSCQKQIAVVLSARTDYCPSETRMQSFVDGKQVAAWYFKLKSDSNKCRLNNLMIGRSEWNGIENEVSLKFKIKPDGCDIQIAVVFDRRSKGEPDSSISVALESVPIFF